MKTHPARLPLQFLALFAVLYLVDPGACVLAQPVNVEAAKRDGVVAVYGTATPQAMDPINKGFEKKYGVRVEYWRASATGVAERALNEWRAERPGFDGGAFS